MKIRTAVDEYRDLIYILIRLIKYEPIGEKFEDSYKKLIQVLLSNIPENKDDLLVLYSESINKYNSEFLVPLNSATEREKAFFNAGRFRGLCDVVKSLGNYDKSLEKFLQPYLELEIGDIVYIKNNNIFYKTVVAKRNKKKIQVRYGNRWFTQDDYLECIFPYGEKINLYENGILGDHHDCDKCAGFRQGKCAYGYSIDTYAGFSYRFDNTKYKVIKAKPKEYCCKNVKR